jgi:hypothetical protein
MTKPKPTKADIAVVKALADELFTLVQGEQGNGFISDGLAEITDHKQFFGFVRGHLFHTRKAARLIEAFLKKYNEY